MSATSSSSQSSGGSPNANRYSWQERLNDHCRQAHLHPPVWNIVSDRRGGRTAWSSTVTVSGQNIPARYWYDGQYVNNAKEDAAEVALGRLQQGSSSSNSSPTSPQATQAQPAAGIYQGQMGGYGALQGTNGTGAWAAR